jgi:LysM repeat protein
MIRRAFPSALLAAGLAVALFLALHVTGHAQPGQCDQTYTVRRDDTLARIAHLLNVSEAELRTANPTTIPANGHLYVGQVLCLPNDTVSLYVDGGASIPTAGASATTWSNPRLAIEVTYQFTPTTADEEDQWNLVTSQGGFVGRRLTMPLQPYNSIKAITDTKQLRAAIVGEPAPVLLAVRNSMTSTTYTLAFIGDQAPPIASLLITDSIPIRLKPNLCNGAPVEQVLGGPRIADVDLRVWLEGPGNMRWPMEISQISFMNNASAAYSCHRDQTVALALVPTARSRTAASVNTGLYQALVLLQHNRFGPAGAVMAANCEQWQGKRGALYWLLRAWSRCP